MLPRLPLLRVPSRWRPTVVVDADDGASDWKDADDDPCLIRVPAACRCVSRDAGLEVHSTINIAHMSAQNQKVAGGWDTISRAHRWDTLLLLHFLCVRESARARAQCSESGRPNANTIVQESERGWMGLAWSAMWCCTRERVVTSPPPPSLPALLSFLCDRIALPLFTCLSDFVGVPCPPVYGSGCHPGESSDALPAGFHV